MSKKKRTSRSSHLTQEEFDRELRNLLTAFEDQVAAGMDIQDARAAFREVHDVIYVKQYTVKSHMRIRHRRK